MSILIPGMEMPTNCYDNCPFFAQIYCGEDHGIVNYCCLENWKQSRTPTPFSVEEAKHGRQDFCRLVPVPEHGPLVDALEVINTFPDGFIFTNEQARALTNYIIPADPANKEGEG